MREHHQRPRRTSQDSLHVSRKSAISLPCLENAQERGPASMSTPTSAHQIIRWSWTLSKPGDRPESKRAKARAHQSQYKCAPSTWVDTANSGLIAVSRTAMTQANNSGLATRWQQDGRGEESQTGQLKETALLERCCLARVSSGRIQRKPRLLPQLKPKLQRRSWSTLLTQSENQSSYQMETGSSDVL